MRLHHLSGDAGCIRNQSMTNLSRVVLGSVASALLGAAAFFAVDGLMPRDVQAGAVGVNIVDYSYEADIDVHLVDFSYEADKDVYVAGKCYGTGLTDVHLTDYSYEADEDWHVVDYSYEADMKICLSGNLESWFENAN